jgi:ABC-type sugar transport system permease subunit
MSANASPSEISKPKIHPFLRALLGFLLLLPACGLCSFNLLPLTINTFMGSFRSFSLAGSGDFVGMNNYGRLFDNPSFPDSFGFTILLIVLHVLAATVFPPVLALAVNSLGKKLHRGVQLLFTLPLAFFGPALVIYGPTFMRGLWNTESPEGTYLLIDSVAVWLWPAVWV